MVARYNGSKMSLYINGIKQPFETDKTDNIPPASPEKETWIGHGDQPKDVAWSYPWVGQIDEVRI